MVTKDKMKNVHIPVLLDNIIGEFEYLKKFDGYFVDGTLGASGHSIALAKEYSKIKFIGVDKDNLALGLASKNIANEKLTEKFTLFHKDFAHVSEILNELNINKIAGALLDLGVSSMQLDDPERGFSFTSPDAPLDMRMDNSQENDARHILNNYPEEALKKIFKEYGEERFAGKIAQTVAKRRKEQSIEKISDLLDALEDAIPHKIIATRRKHFATNVFRALRMEVNNEVGRLEKAIDEIVATLIPGGKIAIITFHSIEDRIVKNALRTLAKPCTCPSEIPFCACGKKPSVILCHKKPIIPTEIESRENPRSRSGKLRVAEKI
jgi:16S rRNA (cytosine1402-N4)-methyltransferase